MCFVIIQVAFEASSSSSVAGMVVRLLTPRLSEPQGTGALYQQKLFIDY